MPVHTPNDRDAQFDEYYGFCVSPAQAMTLMLRLNQSSV